MKVLRAIGGFFARIGRWIANTAWIQPLLIVGGIFGIIFSIPYIKQAIDDAQVDNTDYNYAYYKSKALDLSEGGKADKLFTYLEKGQLENVKKEFAPKFFLAFVEADCSKCKECVDGFKYIEANYKKEGMGSKPVIYTILVDKKKNSDDKETMAKKLLDKHEDLFYDIGADYSEDSYILYKNVPSIEKSYKESAVLLAGSTSQEIDIPTIFMFDYDEHVKQDGRWNSNGFTAYLLNYVDLVSTAFEGEGVNKTTKGMLLRDCWNYRSDSIFGKDYAAD